MRIAVFGHDAGDAMLARRIGEMERLGHEVTAFTMRREDPRDRGWINIDLGRTHDSRLLHRAWAIHRAIGKCRQHARLQGMDLFWARNLDMLAVAVAARRDVQSYAPVIYETLDIHRMLTKKGPAHEMLRKVERRLLRNVAAIVTSSPAYEREYYDKVHPDHPAVTLIENRLPRAALPPRPIRRRQEGPLRLGWIGRLRCARSFALLQQVAIEGEGRIRVELHGIPAYDQLPDFNETASNTPNMSFHGRYHSPTDLPAVYGSVDLVWAGDYYQAQGHANTISNSGWALTNRIYEGGYFSVPAIVPEGTELARWVTAHGTGLPVSDPPENHLLPLLLELKSGRFADLQRTVDAAPKELFADDGSTLSALLCETAVR